MNRFTAHLLFVFVLANAGLSASVVINEIHYHPDLETELVEFVELFNAADTPVDISGWSFSEGIDHVFPANTIIAAGAYYILAQDPIAYNKKFGSIFTGGVKASAGWDIGSLANTGETLTLRDAANAIVDQVDYQAEFPWPINADGGGGSIELLHPSLENDLAGHWRASGKPTGGKANSVLTDNAPPAVRQVAHSPQAPSSSDTIVITAKATDSDAVATMMLEMQAVLPGEYVRLTDADYQTRWESIAMNDVGADSDAVAADFTFTATVPAAMVRHRNLIRYRIIATDALDQSVTLPYEDDPTPNRALFVYDGVPAWRGSPDPRSVATRTFTTEELTLLPVYHLIADGDDVESCQYRSASESRRFRGTLVYDGIVYDHIEFKVRGEFSTYQCGKNKWKFFFNRGEDFQARDNYGDKYPGGFRVMNFSACASPWVPANRGMSGLDEATAFRLHALAGVPSPKTHHLHFRVVDDAEEAPGGDQYGGDLWGLYLSQEHPDGRFLNRLGLADGSTFKIEGGNGDLKHQGPVVSSYSDFVSQARRTQPAEWWHANMNMNSYYGFRAMNRAVGNIDIREGWNHYFYHHPNGQWYPIPWDLDMTFMPETHWSGTIDAKASLSTDEIAVEYASRCRELLDLLLADRTSGGGQLGSVVEEAAQWLGTRKDWIDVERIVKSTSTLAEVRTTVPHGYVTGDQISIAGVETSGYNGPHEVTVTGDVTFTFAVSLFSPGNIIGDAIQAGKAVGGGSAWAEIDTAMWNLHPKTIGGHKDNFYANPTTQGFQGGTLTRTLTSADFAGFADYVKDFSTDTDPDDFKVGDGDQRGYGYNFVRLESDDGKAPNRPVIAYVGGDAFPVDELVFQSSAFAGGSLFQRQTFAAMQWRLGEIYNPSTPSYETNTPWRYEITPVWESGTLSEFNAEMVIPPNAVRPGSNYRARVRQLNQLGGWSHWSEPIEFVAGTPDLSGYADLVISELMYHPGAPSDIELAAGFRREDFEFIELFNRGDALIDLTALRFTKGVDFDFDTGAVVSLEPNETVLVVANPEAFAYRHGASAQVAGAYSGQLANGGELIKLSFGAGTPLIEFTFDDGDGWPSESDGGGASLVRRDYQGDDDLSQAESWSASESGSSPGSVEAGLPMARDTDGDGMSDDAEAFAGTDPNNPLSLLKVTSFRSTSNAVEITWSSIAGKSYEVEYVEKLGAQAWAPLSEITAEGETTTHVDTEAARFQAHMGYYRVRVRLD